MSFDSESYWIERQSRGDRSGNDGYTLEEKQRHRAHKRVVLLEVLREFPGIEKIADLGTGDGWVTRALPVEVDRIDVSPDVVARVPGTRLGTARDLRPVDMVVAFDVLIHVVNDAVFLESLEAIRRCAGLLLVSDGFESPVDARAIHCRFRSLKDYRGFDEIQSWEFPQDLPGLETSRIKLLRCHGD